jgi:hypothetical protein
MQLIIFNHALPMCRAGFPGHFGEPWSNYDGVEIDFVIQYKHLTDTAGSSMAAVFLAFSELQGSPNIRNSSTWSC